MKHSFALFALALGALAFVPSAAADGKAAIKPPVVVAPTPLQHGALQGAPQDVRQAPLAPVQRRVISRTVSAPDQGLKLNDAFVLSMNGGVGTGVADVGLGGGGFFGGNVGGGDFGRSRRFGAARQFQRRSGVSRRGGKRGFGGRR